MTCDEVQDLLPELLPWISGPALAVHEHVQRCPECAELKDDLAHTLHVLDASPGAPELPEVFADRVLARLPDDPGWSVGTPAPRGRVISFKRWIAQGAAAAACFAAGAALTLHLRDGAHGQGWGAPELAQTQRPPRPPRQGVAAPVPHPTQVQVHAGGEPTFVTDSPDRPRRWISAEERPLESYVSQAGLVLEAVAELDERGDPRALQVLRVTLQRSELLDEGDELLALLPPNDGGASADQAQLRRLIAGTQLVLRKVRNARRDASPEVVWALRREVRETGLLDAYRQLLATENPPETPRGRKPSDPL